MGETLYISVCGPFVRVAMLSSLGYRTYTLSFDFFMSGVGTRLGKLPSIASTVSQIIFGPASRKNITMIVLIKIRLMRIIKLYEEK